MQLPSRTTTRKAIAFKGNGTKGMKPVGIADVLKSCQCDGESLWMSTTVLFQYGLAVPRPGTTPKTISDRIERLFIKYPVNNGGKAMGCAVHEIMDAKQEKTNMRGYHILGDDDDIARFWADAWGSKVGVRGFDIANRAFLWTAMVPETVFVPYIDLDEQGQKDDLPRILKERLCPTIEIIEDALYLKVEREHIFRQIFFNRRKKATDSDMYKYSFHVHWYDLGVEHIQDWKQFLLSLVNLPRKMIWTKLTEKNWNVVFDETAPIVDLSVYGGRNQLFRGPFCGKSLSEADAHMIPVSLSIVAPPSPNSLESQEVTELRSGNVIGTISPKLTADTVNDENRHVYILRSRIARSRTGLTMVKLNAFVIDRPPASSVRQQSINRDLSIPVTGMIDLTSDSIYSFVMPIFYQSILPAWQVFRHEHMIHNSNVAGAVVPTAGYEIKDIGVDTSKVGVRSFRVIGDTYCFLDERHVHSQNPQAIGIKIDFMKCTIQQTCYACHRPSPEFNFLHVNNSIRFTLKRDEGAFSVEDAWKTSLNPHQFVLAYWTNEFRFHRKTELMFVYDVMTRTWRSQGPGNRIAGRLVDDLNDRYAKYIATRVQKVTEHRLRLLQNQLEEDANLATIEKQKAKLKSDAVKFLAKNNSICPLTPSMRAEFLDKLATFDNRNEINDFNPIPYLIPLRNLQAYNVFTGDFVEMKKEHLFTSILDAEFLASDSPDCTLFDSWFLEIAAGDRDVAVYLKLIAAYCCTMLTHDRKLYVGKGSGKNAKGLYKDFLLKILEGPAGSEPRYKILPQTFWEKRTGGSGNSEGAKPEAYMMLHRSLFYTDDLDRVPIDSAKCKTIVAAEPQSVRTIYGKPVVTALTGKNLWTTNWVIDAPGNDNAWWERLVVIPFLAKYVDDGFPINPERYIFRRNEAYAKELLEKSDGFFTVAMRELTKYYRSLPWDNTKNQPSKLGGFPLPSAVEKAIRDCREVQLPLASFMREHTAKTTVFSDFVPIDKLFENYIVYLENKNEKKLKSETTQASFVRLLASALDIGCTKKHVQGIRVTNSVQPRRDPIRFTSGEFKSDYTEYSSSSSTAGTTASHVEVSVNCDAFTSEELASMGTVVRNAEEMLSGGK